MALPPIITTIVSIIGHGPAMDMVRELGGQDYRFPISKTSASWEYLVEIVGYKNAGKLVGRFGGEEVYIALCHDALRIDRNRLMIQRYDYLLRDGHSSRGAVSMLVTEFRPISNRTVEKIINGPVPSALPEVSAQGSLF